MRAGIIGFPQVGKTTLFQILTRAKQSPPRSRADTHVGVALVPDERLSRLSDLLRPKKTTAATIDYVDVAGMSRGHVSEGKTQSELKTTDALVHVIRTFEDPSIAHVEGSIDPRRDFASLEVEFILADLAIVESRLERVGKDLKKKQDKDLHQEQELMLQLKQNLESEKPLRALDLSAEQQRRARGFAFLSLKPQLVVLNLDEAEVPWLDQAARRYGLSSSAPRTAFTAVCGKIEAEIAQLSEHEAASFLEELGFSEPGLNRVIRETYQLLGLISFFTLGDECRAWTIPRALPALQAAGVVHSDIERGFIRAEVCRWEDLVEHRSIATLREKGLLRLEGKDYPVQDGDVINFRFNI